MLLSQVLADLQTDFVHIQTMYQRLNIMDNLNRWMESVREYHEDKDYDGFMFLRRTELLPYEQQLNNVITGSFNYRKPNMYRNIYNSMSDWLKIVRKNLPHRRPVRPSDLSLLKNSLVEDRPDLDLINLGENVLQPRSFTNRIIPNARLYIVPDHLSLSICKWDNGDIYIGRWLENGYGMKYTASDKSMTVGGPFNYGLINNTIGISLMKGNLSIGTFTIISNDVSLTGLGIRLHKTGHQVIGNYENNLVSGFSVCTTNGITYIGDMANSMITGSGLMLIGLTLYAGQLLNGEGHGLAIKYYDRDKIYIGTFEHKLQNGFGVLYEKPFAFGDYRIYAGNWVNRDFTGQGTLLISSDDYYEGTWNDWNKEGTGIFHTRSQTYREVWANGQLISQTPIPSLNDRDPILTEAQPRVRESRLWWKAICEELDDLPKEALINIYKSILNESYKEAQRRVQIYYDRPNQPYDETAMRRDFDYVDDLEYLMSLSDEDIQRADKSELCQTTRNLWETWESSNQEMFSGSEEKRCVNTSFIPSGKTFDETDIDEVIIIPHEGKNYCFTVDELQKLDVNPYIRQNFPINVKRIAKQRLAHLNKTYVNYGETKVREEKETLPAHVVILVGLFETLGLDSSYLIKLGQLSRDQLRELGTQIYNILSQHVSDPQLLKPQLYNMFVRLSIPTNLNLWLTQILRTNPDLTIIVAQIIQEYLDTTGDSILPTVVDNILPRIQTIHPDLAFVYREIERLAHSSAMSHPNLDELDEFNRRRIVEYINRAIQMTRLHQSRELYNQAYNNSTSETIGKWLRNVYETNSVEGLERLERLEGLSNQLLPLIESIGTENMNIILSDVDM